MAIKTLDITLSLKPNSTPIILRQRRNLDKLVFFRTDFIFISDTNLKQTKITVNDIMRHLKKLRP